MSQWWLKKTTTGEACGDLGRMVGHILQLDPEGYTSSEASDLTCSDSDSGSYVSEGETPSSHDLARSLSQLQGRPGTPKTSAEVQLLQQILKMLDKSGMDTDSQEEENIFKKCVIDYASREKVTFADIVGCHEAKASLKMDFISHAEDKDWKRCSPSYCFYGPPGTGKTSLFKALMSALGADFTYCYLSAARLNDKYHGVSEKRLQSIFDEARKAAPCLIFVDEIDGIMKSRDADKGGNSGLLALKTTMLENLSGMCGVNSGVFLVSATNFPWHLEPAFIRRSEMIYVGLPTGVEERVQILKLYLGDVATKISPSEWQKIGRMTEKMSASDLKKISNKVWSLVKHEMKSSSSFMEQEPDANLKVFAPAKEKKTRKTLNVPYHILKQGKNVKIIPCKVEKCHFFSALCTIRPSCTPELLQKYKMYKRCGQVFD